MNYDDGMRDMPGRLSRRNVLKMGLLASGALAVGSSVLSSAAMAQGASRPVIIGFSQEPTNFHPLMPSIEVDQGVHWNVFSTLWGVDEKGAYTPDLAVEVPTTANQGISADGLTWSVKLRGDAKWHDGTPFTAEDVKFTLDLLRNPDFKAGTRTGHDQIADVTVVSPTELRWTMKQRVAPYLAVLAWTFIVPQHILGRNADINSRDFSNQPVGTGPFKWVSRTSGDQITLEANADYHGGAPAVSGLVFKYVPDLVVLATQFQTGAIDYIGLEGIQVDKAEEAKSYPGKSVVLAPQPFVETITLNLERPVFKDLAVRQALYLAIDKQSLLASLYYGIPQSAESYLPQQAKAHNPDLPKHEYNPEEAKRLLDEAGWVVESEGIRAKNGVRLEFTLQATAGNQVREQLQQYLQQTWRDIGVDLKLQTMPPAVLWADNWVFSKFDAIVAGTGFMAGPDADTTQYFDSRSIPAQGGTGLNNFQYKNPEVDELLRQGRETLDEDARIEIYRKQQAIIRNDLPFLPIYHKVGIEGTDAALSGYVPNVNVLANCWNARTWRWA